jgi:thiamine pyrophosphokinase
VAGGGGGPPRLAHIFAIKALFEKQTLVSEWWTAHERVILLQENITQRLQVKKDAVLSIFPTGAAPWHLTSENLKWKLDNFAWTRDTFGISNVALEEEIIVHAIRGCFLIIIEY